MEVFWESSPKKKKKKEISEYDACMGSISTEQWFDVNISMFIHIICRILLKEILFSTY